MYNHTVSYVQYFFWSVTVYWNFRKSLEGHPSASWRVVPPRPNLRWTDHSWPGWVVIKHLIELQWDISINNSNRILANWFKGNLGWSYCSYHSTGSWSFFRIWNRWYQDVLWPWELQHGRVNCFWGTQFSLDSTHDLSFWVTAPELVVYFDWDDTLPRRPMVTNVCCVINL